jgi:nucleotide-binding universal stress UspA family protein
VHVVPPVPVPYQPLVSPAPAFDTTAYLQELTKVSKETLQEHADKDVPQGIERTLSVTAGDPAYEILRLSQDLEADLIIIATHGRGGWQRFLFGSVAEKVVRQAACPVLVVHAPKGAGR